MTLLEGRKWEGMLGAGTPPRPPLRRWSVAARLLQQRRAVERCARAARARRAARRPARARPAAAASPQARSAAARRLRARAPRAWLGSGLGSGLG